VAILARRLLVFALALAPVSSPASTIVFDPGHLVASVHTRGQYDNAGLTTWNGQPLTPENQPTLDENQLSADWNFYVDPAAPNQLFIEALNVQDTTHASLTGVPFDLVALTSFTFRLTKVDLGEVLAVGFTNSWARPGQVLDGSPVGDPPLQVPLTETINWNLTTGAPNEFTIGTANVNYAMSHFTDISAATRIVGGGVVQFTFEPALDLLRDVDFRELTASAFHGLGAYEAPGSIDFSITPIPEPSTAFLLALGLTVLALRRRAR
jgi:hypothetical protein